MMDRLFWISYFFPFSRKDAASDIFPNLLCFCLIFVLPSLYSFYTSKSQLQCNSFTPRIKLAARKVSGLA